MGCLSEMELVDDLHGHFAYRTHLGVDQHVSRPVARFALGQQRPDFLLWFCLIQQGPMGVVAHTLVNCVRRGPKTNHQGVIFQALQVRWMGRQPAARRNDRFGSGRQLLHDPSLPIAESRLAILFKNGGDRFARTSFDNLVGIQIGKMHQVRHQAAHGGLPRAHKTYQSQVVDAPCAAHPVEIPDFSGIRTQFLGRSVPGTGPLRGGKFYFPSTWSSLILCDMSIPAAFQRLGALVLTIIFPLLPRGAEPEAPIAGSTNGHTFNVLDYGARGDGQTLDTAALNQAVEACGNAGGGQVHVPAGNYLSGTIHLRSHVTLFLEAGAVLMGTTNLSAYEQPEIPAFMPEARWGKWHRALLVGQDLEQVAIAGPGVIDGQKVYDPAGEERMRGPHTINFVGCKGVTLRDFSIIDSANYAIFFQLSDNVEIRGLTITGGWDGVHFRGGPGRPCRNVDIIGCRFYTGDDSVAGRYWENVVLSGCILNSSCNGLRLIGPAKSLLVDHCVFYGPGRRPHRSGGRTNMLAGIILQPGAWDRTEGLLDDVVLTDNSMNNVAAPVTIWTKSGNPVGRITVAGLNATGVYRSALSVENWGDTAISNVVVRNASIQFAGGGSEAQGRPTVGRPGVDPRALPVWGVYARNVQQLTLEDVRLSLVSSDQRPVMRAEQIEQLTLDNVRFTHVAGVAEPLVQTNVAKLILRDTTLSTP